MGFHIFDVDAVAGPERLLGVGHHDIAELDVLALAEHLGRLLAAVTQFHAAAVPERRACAFGEEAVRREEILAAPENVFPLEPAVVRFDVGAFLDGGFSLVDGDVFEMKTVFIVERPFAAEFLIFDGFHCIVWRLFLQKSMQR